MAKFFGFGVIGAVLVFGFWLWGSYNGLITGREDVRQHVAEYQSQLQRQADLVPNAVETAKGMAGSENKTLREVIEARQQASALLAKVTAAGAASDPEVMKQLIAASAAMNQAMLNMNLVREAYPKLRQAEGFLRVFTILEGSQNRVVVARGRLQRVIESYNVRVMRFPGNIVAGQFGFKEMPYFAASEEAQKTPVVKF